MYTETLTTGASGTSLVGVPQQWIKIDFEETDGDRWYLRVNSDNDEAMQIVSESYVNNLCLNNIDEQIFRI